MLGSIGIWLGPLIAFVWFAIVYFLGKPSTLPEAFLSASSFLLWWYIITSIIKGFIITIISTGVVSVGTLMGDHLFGRSGGKLFGLMGLSVSVLLAIRFIVKTAFSIGGAYAISRSVVIASDGVAEWNMPILILGSLLLALKMMMNK